MQIQKYTKPEYPTKLNDMYFSYSIGEMNKDYESEVILSQEIMKIAAKWLSLNIKSKSINTDEGLMVVVDHIMEECSNLELQEINFIFRSGISGKFGVIYNDISIDTICGKEGWIETYYKDFRKLRKETDKTIVLDSSSKLDGHVMTLQEFHEKNPEFKKKYDLINILQRAKEYKTTIDDAKQFYKIKQLTLDDLKEDMAYFSKLWQKSDKSINEKGFINECLRRFIIDNIYKTKQ